MYSDANCVEIDQIILHLSRKNTVKKFTVTWLYSYKYPLSLFSLKQLTYLSLGSGEFEFSPTTFSGFGNLRSFHLEGVITSRETLMHLISTCPKLESLSLDHCPEDADGFDLNELVKCLPVIQHLSVTCPNIECFATGEALATLVRLKSFCMLEMFFVLESHLRALFLLIRSSPNLEKIKLEQEVEEKYCRNPDMNSLDDYSDMWLEHLKELEIEDFTTLEIELEFVKLILAKSPVLKKVRIVVSGWVKIEEEVNILRSLLRFPHASPVVDIIVKRLW